MAKGNIQMRSGRSSPGQRGRDGSTRARQEESDDLLQELEVFTMEHSESPPVGESEPLSAGESEQPPADEPERFVFVCPGAGDRRVTAEEVRSGGTAVRRILQAEALDPEGIARVRAVAVVAGEMVGRRGETPDEGDLVTAGKKVRIAATGECRTARYGYLCLEDGELSVLPPLWVDPQGMEVYWLLLDERPQPVTREMILWCLADQEVVEGIKGDLIEALVQQVRSGEHECGAVLIAAGVAAEQGKDAQVEILVDHQRIAGEEREDGSIDFRETNFAANVQVGQVVARRRAATAGRSGMTVRGDRLEGRDGRDQPLKPGENVEVRNEDGFEVFVSTITGAFVEEDGTVAVVKRLHIREDVDFRTGNLDFDGEVFIGGSVVQGFRVKATSHVTIARTVETSATVSAGGDLTVGLGIVGRKTRATAKGMVRAQFVQEATVTAGRDIVLGSFAYQARLHAGGDISIEKGAGSRRGSAVGGQLWAHRELRVLTAGSPGQVQTVLIAGVDQERLLKLDRMKNAVDQTYNQSRRLLGHFGLSEFDVGQIKNMLGAATGPRRKVLANKARQLGKLAQLYQKLRRTYQQFEEEIGAQVQKAEIRVLERAFPGVVVRLGGHQRQLTEIALAPRFRVVDGKLVKG